MTRDTNRKLMLFPLFWAMSPWVWFGLMNAHVLEFFGELGSGLTAIPCFLPSMAISVFGVRLSLYGGLVVSSIGNLLAGLLLIRFRDRIGRFLTPLYSAFFSESPPNQSSDPTPALVTPPAGQEARRD